MAEAGRGGIVLFSSMYGTVSPDPSTYPAPIHPNPIEYGVGKAGIQQMARYLEVRVGPSRVRCNSVSPGPFPFVSQQQSQDWMDRINKRCPMGRVGRPEEIAGSVHFLLADAFDLRDGSQSCGRWWLDGLVEDHQAWHKFSQA